MLNFHYVIRIKINGEFYYVRGIDRLVVNLYRNKLTQDELLEFDNNSLTKTYKLAEVNYKEDTLTWIRMIRGFNFFDEGSISYIDYAMLLREEKVKDILS